MIWWCVAGSVSALWLCLKNNPKCHIVLSGVLSANANIHASLMLKLLYSATMTARIDSRNEKTIKTFPLPQVIPIQFSEK